MINQRDGVASVPGLRHSLLFNSLSMEGKLPITFSKDFSLILAFGLSRLILSCASFGPFIFVSLPQSFLEKSNAMALNQILVL